MNKSKVSISVTRWLWVLGVLVLVGGCGTRSKSANDPELGSIGFPYRENVWVNYLFDEAHPEESVIIANPYSDKVRGRRASGIRNGVIYSNWTTEEKGKICGWKVYLRADPPVMQIAGRTVSLKNGRFMTLSDSKAQELPKQIAIPIPAGMKSETEIRKWLDGIREAGGMDWTTVPRSETARLGNAAVGEHGKTGAVGAAAIVEPGETASFTGEPDGFPAPAL